MNRIRTRAAAGDRLRERYDEATNRYRHLRQAMARWKQQTVCAENDHEWEGIQCVAGWNYSPQRDVEQVIGRKLPADGMWGGYQTGWCLVCGLYVLSDYAGKHRMIISKKQADALST